MTLIPVTLPPGLERNNGPYDTPGRFWDMNQVRWQSGSMRQIGGWNRLTGSVLDGAVRKIFSYRDNSNQLHTLVGTDEKLYCDTGGYTDITPDAFVPLSNIGVSGGYGTFTYGTSTYGTARPAPSPIFSPYAYWTFGSWGEDGILTANSDGRLFYYTTSTPTVAPIVISGAPTGNNSVLVTNERHVMAIGCTGAGDERTVAWSSSEDYTDWNFASTTNTAGFQQLSTSSPLTKGVRVREGVLIFSQSNVFLCTYVGLPYVYGFQAISNVEMMHPDSIATFNGNAVWLDREGFKIYSNGVVSALDCPILNDVLEEMDPLYGTFRIHASHNGAFPEIWFFYPTTGETEANKYVMWNFSENWWGWGFLSRSAMFPSDVYQFPYMGDALGNMYQHEDGVMAAGQPMFQDTFVESGALLLGNGDRFADVNMMLIETDSQAMNSVSVAAYTQFTPLGAETVFGPYVPRADGYTDTRINARSMRLRWASVADGPWAVGVTSLDVAKQTGGQRR